ncbi:unnamed protein product [Rhizopus stolonifer]
MSKALDDEFMVYFKSQPRIKLDPSYYSSSFAVTKRQGFEEHYDYGGEDCADHDVDFPVKDVAIIAHRSKQIKTAETLDN